ncbi:MAG: hydroxymethylbilane synthase [Acidimicrobiales bacterium]
MTGPLALRLATRGSPLAMWQARRVEELLHRSGVSASLVVVETTGDRRLDVPLDRLGGQGVFVKEVQAAVIGGEADAAVHSAKDLPASAEHCVPGLVLAAFPERADPRDVLVGGRLATLPVGATVATGSARRRVQLANLRPDLTFAGLRGNLATRLATVGAGGGGAGGAGGGGAGAVRERGVAAVVVAKAALDRLDWSPPAGLELEVFDTGTMLPQVGQGALAVECREDDAVARRALAAIDDLGTRRLVTSERAFLAELGGGCTLPVGAHAEFVEPGPQPDRTAIRLNGMLASADGLVVLRHELTGDRPDRLGRAVARYLLDGAGGHDLGEWGPGSGADDEVTVDRPPGATR